jgi:sensor domain CHASE-containing protein
MRLGTLVVVLIVHAALVLGGVWMMLTAFGEQLDRELDREVSRVERNLERDFDRIRRDVRRDLDERLPPTGATPVP